MTINCNFHDYLQNIVSSIPVQLHSSELKVTFECNSMYIIIVCPKVWKCTPLPYIYFTITEWKLLRCTFKNVIEMLKPTQNIH